MSNLNGNIYGLTILAPIREDPDAEIPPSLAIQIYLAKLPRDHDSPFARLSSTHMCRLTVLEDIVRVTPVIEQRMKTRFLLFEANFDGDLRDYLTSMAMEESQFVQAVWQHCEGYPGLTDISFFVAYMMRCQLETTFYFADINDKTVHETLIALRVQNSISEFIEDNQGKSVNELRAAFAELRETVRYFSSPNTRENRIGGPRRA